MNHQEFIDAVVETVKTATANYDYHHPEDMMANVSTAVETLYEFSTHMGCFPDKVPSFLGTDAGADSGSDTSKV